MKVANRKNLQLATCNLQLPPKFIRHPAKFSLSSAKVYGLAGKLLNRTISGQAQLNMKTLKLHSFSLLFCWLLFPPFAPSAKEPSANLELARQLNQAFVEVAEKVSPAVVVINVI